MSQSILNLLASETAININQSTDQVLSQILEYWDNLSNNVKDAVIDSLIDPSVSEEGEVW